MENIIFACFLKGKIVIMRTKSLKGSSVKSLAMVRMGYADEQLCTFLHRLAVEIHSTELSHYIMHVRSCGHDSTSFDDYRCYLAGTLVCA